LLNRASAHRSTSGAPLVKPCYLPCCLSCVRILEHLLQRLQDLLRLPRRPSGRRRTARPSSRTVGIEWQAGRCYFASEKKVGAYRNQSALLVDRLLIKLQKTLKIVARLKIFPIRVYKVNYTSLV